MTHAPLRVMYWPNEPVALGTAGLQVGPRQAFEAMAADGTIAALSILPFHRAWCDSPTPIAFIDRALAAIRDFAPDILFAQHLAGIDVPAKLWRRLRLEMPNVTFVYHEDDPFDRVVKRIDRATACALRHADLVFASGLGDLAALFRRHGATEIAYLPSCFSRRQFGRSDPRSVHKTHDVVSIGTRGRRRRLRFLYLPGGRRRARFVGALTAAFGARFAVYGAGWRSASAKGQIPYADQERVLQTGRISANWDHFDTIERYFSDRLPISLAAALPHVTTHHSGFETFFADCPGLYACCTVEQAIDTCRRLVARPDEALAVEGLAARDWAFAHLECEIVFRQAMQQVTVLHARRIAA